MNGAIYTQRLEGCQWDGNVAGNKEFALSFALSLWMSKAKGWK
jgi:hypothetical protein